MSTGMFHLLPILKGWKWTVHNFGYPFLMMDYYARGILKGLDIKQIWEEEREDEEEEDNGRVD